MPRSVDVPNYFFLNDKLHKKIKVIKSQNWIVAFCYVDEKRVQYDLSYVRRNYSNAYKTKEIYKLLRVSKPYLDSLRSKNMVNEPSGRTYSIRSYRPGFYMWSEDDLLELRDRLYDLAPKDKYGLPSGRLNLISRAELQAVFGSESYYVQTKSGEMVKVWKAFNG